MVHVECVLWGAYGSGNTGDELILSLALEEAKKEHKDSVVVLSGNPLYTRWLFPHCTVVPFDPVISKQSKSRVFRILDRILATRMKSYLPRPDYNLSDQLRVRKGEPDTWVDLIRNAGLLRLVGGGYLTDIFPLNWNLLPLELALFCGIPIQTGAIQLGPFLQPGNGRRVATLLKDSDIKVRDQASLEYCKKWDLRAHKVRDDCYKLRRIFPDLLRHTPSQAQPRIGLCISLQPDHPFRSSFVNWTVHLLRCLRKTIPTSSIFGFCFFDGDRDFELTLEVFDGAGINLTQAEPHSLNYKKNIRSLSSIDILVTTRFHAAVLATLLDVPFFAIAQGGYYLAKMKEVVDQSNSLGTLIMPEKDDVSVIAAGIVARWQELRS